MEDATSTGQNCVFHAVGSVAAAGCWLEAGCCKFGLPPEAEAASENAWSCFPAATTAATSSMQKTEDSVTRMESLVASCTEQTTIGNDRQAAKAPAASPSAAAAAKGLVSFRPPT